MIYIRHQALVLFKSRKLRWVEHVAYRCRQEIHSDIWKGNILESSHLQNNEEDGRILLGLNLEK